MFLTITALSILLRASLRCDQRSPLLLHDFQKIRKTFEVFFFPSPLISIPPQRATSRSVFSGAFDYDTVFRGFENIKKFFKTPSIYSSASAHLDRLIRLAEIRV